MTKVFNENEKATLNALLDNSNKLEGTTNAKYLVKTNIWKCYQNGHWWFNNFHSFWVATKEEAFKVKAILEAMGVSVTLKTALGYDVKDVK